MAGKNPKNMAENTSKETEDTLFSEAPAQGPKENGKKRLSKRTKTLILSAIIILVLLGGFLGLQLFLKNAADVGGEDSSSGFDSVEVLTLYEHEREDLESIDITNKTGSYSISVAERKTNDSGVESQSITYTVNQLNGLPMVQENFAAPVTAVYYLNAQKLIEENPADWAKYGLENPVTTAVVKFADGSSETLFVGDPAPTSGQSYLKIQGKENVYTVYTTTLAALERSATDYLDLALIPAAEVDENGSPKYPTIDKMTIDRTDWKYPYTILSQNPEEVQKKEMSAVADAYIITEPVSAIINANKGMTAITGVFGLTADKAVAANPTDAELETYGLLVDEANGKKPFCQVRFTVGGKPFGITIGNKIESGTTRYLIMDELNVVFSVDEAKLPWVTLTESQLFSSMMTTTYIYNLQKLEIITPQGAAAPSTTFTFTGKEDDESFEAFRDGEKMDLEYFKTFYQFVLSAPAEELWLDPPTSTEPLLTFKYTASNGYTKDISFFPSTDRMVVIAINGEYNFRCRQSYVDRLISNLLLLDEDKPILTSF